MQRVTLIDNYDSFTFNLVHYLGELGAEVSVWRNDEITVADALAAKPDAIVLSPGPCTPNEAGVCLDLVRAASETTPMLGVCLGHQAIGQAFGGDIVRAPTPMHGKVSRISHNARGLFRGLNGPFSGDALSLAHHRAIERARRTRDQRGERRRARHGRCSTATARRSGCSSIRRASPASTAGKSCAISWTWPTPFISASKLSDENAKRGHGILQASDRQSRRRGDADPDRGGKRLRFDAFGRSDALADGRVPDGAQGAGRDGRRDHRRGRGDARQDAQREGAAGRDRHRRHRRRRFGLLQCLDAGRDHYRRLRRARSPSTAIALRPRARAPRTRSPRSASRSGFRPTASSAASTRPGSAS